MDNFENNKLPEKFVNDIKAIIRAGQQAAFKAVDKIAIMTFWKIGRRIVEEEQGGDERAEYGSGLINDLSKELSTVSGSLYSDRNLRYYRQFYLMFKDYENWHMRVPNLEWSHFRRLLSVKDEKARMWYVKEASECMWSVKTLDRNVSTHYYHRRLAAIREGKELPVAIKNEKETLNYIKSPVVAEFIGSKRSSKLDEPTLEDALIDNLEQFIMKLCKGFAFVEQQQHIMTETDDFYIDLVFYNFKMKRFVLFELKTHKLTHKDIGQLDMYVRMCDDLIKDEDDNPTIGVLLCTDTDKTLARYSVLHDNDQLFAATYMAYMPTEEELCYEIERQRQFFLEQHSDINDKIS